MKNFNLLNFLIIIVSSFMFIQCTSDPIAGPQGTAGIDGTNGTNGTNGVDGTAECVECHNNTTRDHVNNSYLLSVHANETLHNSGGVDYTTSQYTNRTGCVQCHTSQGYIDNLNGTTLGVGAGYIAGDPAYSGTQTITCITCHAKHYSFDFVNDGFDFALRQGLRPVTLITNPDYSIDLGSSNTCINCHQPRTTFPAEDANFKVMITSSRFNPHHGPQSTLLEGIQGAEYDGMSYPTAKSAGHRTVTCASCHMGETTDGSDGNHTWHPTANACITCHTGGEPASVTGLDAQRTALATLLGTVYGQKIAKDAFGVYQPVFEVDGVTPVMNTNAMLVNGATQIGYYDVKFAKALWNYNLLVEDKSNGIHNPLYAKALIANSIIAIN